MKVFSINGNSDNAVRARFAVAFLCYICMHLFPGASWADTRVDGFFRENLLEEGFFGGNEAVQAEQRNTNKPESFFITREERRRNPEKAPSNSIKVERQPPLVVRQRMYYPYHVGSPLWRGNLWGQLPPGVSSSQNNPMATSPYPTGPFPGISSSPVPTQSPLFP